MTAEPLTVKQLHWALTLFLEAHPEKEHLKVRAFAEGGCVTVGIGGIEEIRKDCIVLEEV
jgi:hypothetical protein